MENNDLFRKKPIKLLILVALIVLFVVLGKGLLAESQNPNAEQTAADSNNSTPSQSFGASSDVVLNIVQSENQALVTLYNETGGADWNNSSGWLSGTTPCTWFGIVCSGGSVIEINLPDNNLRGNIPQEISLLTNLKTLNLEFNHLSGSIPPELGKLNNLESLSLTGNSRLSGPIPPELGNLTNLNTLILSSHEGGTQLSGPIPPELGNLTRLTFLEISNSLLSGPIPPELGNLTNLQWFDLGNNRLSGPVPSELGNLVNLQTLSIGEGNNKLSGALPLSLIGLKKLRFFQFQETDLCEPPEAAFQAWLNSIEELYRTDVLCQTDN